MINPASHIKNIFVEREIVDLPYTQKILGRVESLRLPVAIVDTLTIPGLNPNQYPENLTKGKQNLLLCRNRGHFFKPCPGTKEYRCCGYQVLNIGMNCPMDCVYCILQAYLNNPWLSSFVNVEDLLAEIARTFAAEPERRWRIGTGEFTDSLALDELTGLSRELVPFIGRHPNAVLELKTKSAAIANLEGLSHQGRVIVAWSLNSPSIMRGEEWRTATLDERLQAAAQCAQWGYRLAFHFDPIIDHPGWREGYTETIDCLFRSVPADKIAWISLGALRFLPPLKQISARRFPKSRFMFEEFVPGLDGKQRYFRARRVELYRHLFKELKGRVYSKTCIYLCMESDEIWEEVFGFVPDDFGGLAAMLEGSVL
ncbi:MAG: DNA photolyase [Proteobacteria bacterium]|nr:DNA photolyase [Desulfobulbaceae bacterium]MBU4152198.1 DNA photolyase [Pseudomonadota bacterium]MDP2107090.1 DNA photolyase [Desulfobulbaceae bacterium]